MIHDAEDKSVDKSVDKSLHATLIERLDTLCGWIHRPGRADTPSLIYFTSLVSMLQALVQQGRETNPLDPHAIQNVDRHMQHAQRLCHYASNESLLMEHDRQQLFKQLVDIAAFWPQVCTEGANGPVDCQACYGSPNGMVYSTDQATDLQVNNSRKRRERSPSLELAISDLDQLQIGRQQSREAQCDLASQRLRRGLGMVTLAQSNNVLSSSLTSPYWNGQTSGQTNSPSPNDNPMSLIRDDESQDVITPTYQQYIEQQLELLEQTQAQLVERPKEQSLWIQYSNIFAEIYARQLQQLRRYEYRNLDPQFRRHLLECRSGFVEFYYRYCERAS